MRHKQSNDRQSHALMKRPSGVPRDYKTFLEDLKSRIRSAQMRAALAVNRELIQLYWDIGRSIALKQATGGWGKSVVERLAADLQRSFPGISGFSASNIWRMRAFYLAYASDLTILAQPVRELAPGKKLAPPVRELQAEIVPQAVGHMGTPPIVARTARASAWCCARNAAK